MSLQFSFVWQCPPYIVNSSVLIIFWYGLIFLIFFKNLFIWCQDFQFFVFLFVSFSYKVYLSIIVFSFNIYPWLTIIFHGYFVGNMFFDRLIMFVFKYFPKLVCCYMCLWLNNMVMKSFYFTLNCVPLFLFVNCNLSCFLI